MIDVRLLRTNIEGVRTALARRGKPEVLSQIDEAVQLDSRLRDITTERDAIRAEVNDLSKQVGTLRRDKRNDEAEALMGRSRELGETERVLQAEFDEVQGALHQIMLRIPNLPHADAPNGAGDHENPVVKGPINMPAQFADHQRVPHWETASHLGILDNERATKIAGAMFTMQRGLGATLARALCQFALDSNADAFEEIRPPSFVTTATLTATGHLPKFADDAYAIERDDLWAIPTAEVPLTSLHAGEVLEESELPVRLMAYTPCYRREAGSAGRDTSGMLRQHQFEKVEMVSIVKPEDSDLELDRMTKCAQGILEKLELPYRTVKLCTGDMGFSAKRTNDIEVWLPGQNAYREISSCSTCGDFQSRRMNARFRRTGAKKPEFVHTLNGSGLAVGRCSIAVLENGQQEDGSVILPKALKQHLGGKTRLNTKGILE